MSAVHALDARPYRGSASSRTVPQLTIDAEALAHNTRLFARRTPGELMAVVKADGFGHGAMSLATAALANGATSLGVTSLDEALALRAAGIAAPILSWLNPVDADFGAARSAGIEVAVPGTEHLSALVRASHPARRPLLVHLHLDTGLARDGAAPREWADLCRGAALAERSGTIDVVGIMGHLPCADTPDHPANRVGRNRFLRGVRIAHRSGLRPRLRHLAATSATLSDPQAHHTLSRVGAGLVGIDLSGSAAGRGLRPAMRLTAPVVGVRRVGRNTGVGYGLDWTAPSPTTLALLPLGYADGLPRSSAGQAQVQLNGRRCPIVGRISMDQIVVDCGDLPVRSGDEATLFGNGERGEPSVGDWARWSRTIEHEIVTGIGGRVARV